MNQANKHGFIFGLLCPGDWRAKKEATMYSYNGVVLPKLPEWDRETYPYAYIGLRFDGYCLFVYHNIRVVNDANKIGVTYGGLKWIYTDGAWQGGNTMTYPMEVIWANCDVYYNESAGGGLYLAKSDPVPVYE